MLRLELPDYTAAQKAADALAPHIEDAWSRFAKQGHTWMSLTAWVLRDVVMLLTSDPSIVEEKGLTLPPVHEQYWLCTPDALEHCLRRMLPTWFEICRTPMSDFPFEYRVTYTGPNPNSSSTRQRADLAHYPAPVREGDIAAMIVLAGEGEPEAERRFYFVIAKLHAVKNEGMGCDDFTEDEDPGWAVVVSPVDLNLVWPDQSEDMANMPGDYYSILDGVWEFSKSPREAHNELRARGFIENYGLMSHSSVTEIYNASADHATSAYATTKE